MRRLFLIAILSVAACKQGEGERCQVEADCESGLVCNQSTMTCQASLSGVDGNLSPDANVDAGTDPVDAAVDATVDASPPDAP
jgi:hypothetical protein